MNNPFVFLVAGYLLTVLIESPVLWFGLHRQYDNFERWFACLWLTACTYPVVVLVLPPLMASLGLQRGVYLLIAETFAPVAECLLFRIAMTRPDRTVGWRDYVVIVAANLTSFLIGESMRAAGWF